MTTDVTVVSVNRKGGTSLYACNFLLLRLPECLVIEVDFSFRYTCPV